MPPRDWNARRSFRLLILDVVFASPISSILSNVEVEEVSCWDGSPDSELAAEANAVELGRTIEVSAATRGKNSNTRRYFGSLEELLVQSYLSIPLVAIRMR